MEQLPVQSCPSPLLVQQATLSLSRSPSSTTWVTPTLRALTSSSWPLPLVVLPSPGTVVTSHTPTTGTPAFCPASKSNLRFLCMSAADCNGRSDWPVCYNGSSTELPSSPLQPAPVPAEYLDAPLPAGEVPNQGGPQGGDISVIYESNWDLWQQWVRILVPIVCSSRPNYLQMNPLTMQLPYMVLPGNHEVCEMISLRRPEAKYVLGCLRRV